MSYRCDRCRKGRLIGRNVRHKKGVAGGQWKKRAPKTRKISLPNLQSFKGILNGKKGKWKLCAKCLKMVKKQLKADSKQIKVKTKADKKQMKTEKKTKSSAKSKANKSG